MGEGDTAVFYLPRSIKSRIWLVNDQNLNIKVKKKNYRKLFLYYNSVVRIRGGADLKQRDVDTILLKNTNDNFN